MPSYSARSRERLEMCHPDLQFLFNRVIECFDCSILAGHRGAAQQEMLFRTGKTKVRWPESKHNSEPSLAVDVAPYPVDWNLRDPQALKRWYYFGGLVMGLAQAFGIRLRWGGDWDRDSEFDDQTFNDLPHFELTDR